MNKAMRILIIAAGLCLATSAMAGAATIKIDPGGYAGIWTVDYGPPHQGPAWISLGRADAVVHAHVISLGGAEIFFNVGWGGTVSVTPKVAADTGFGWLRFNTTTIEVDPVLFTGSWRIAGGGTGDLVGAQKISLVRGLKFYNLEVGATGGFSFDVAGDGTVTVRNPLAASGGFHLLMLNSTERFLR